ncbi:hypothetical protein D3C77_408720 [compost metagenome]
MDAEERELGRKLVTAKDLTSALSSYHTALARLGSGMISLSSALMTSEDPKVKAAAQEAWGKIDEFIGFMEKAAENLNHLLHEPGPDDGE